MKALPLLTRGLPALLGILSSGCQQQDGQMQARLADAEARAKQAEAAVTELKKKAAEAPAAASSGDPGELQDLKKRYAALEEENKTLQELAEKARAGAGNPLAGIDAKAVEAAFVNGFLEKKKEWKDALSDYQVKGYEQPEVTVEDVKPFRTSIGIKLEQAGRSFTAQVPVTADFQGNWTFPAGDDVIAYARQAAAGQGGAPAQAPAQTPTAPPSFAQNPPAAPVSSPQAPAAPAQPRPDPRPAEPEGVPFGGKNLIKLPPIKFPGDP